MKETLLQKTTEQSDYLYKLAEVLEGRRIKRSESKDFLYHRAKLIGMIDLLQVVGIPVDEFQWVYNSI
jgi:hypothetical protein